MYRGLAKLVGMTVLPTGTAIDDELATLQEHWEEFDFFFVHYKRTDSAARTATSTRKVAALEEVDAVIPDLRDLEPGRPHGHRRPLDAVAASGPLLAPGALRPLLALVPPGPRETFNETAAGRRPRRLSRPLGAAAGHGPRPPFHQVRSVTTVRRTPIIAGNWKMHTTAESAAELCRGVRERIDGIDGVEKVVCPPFPFLALVARRAEGQLDQGGRAERVLGGEGRLHR